MYLLPFVPKIFYRFLTSYYGIHMNHTISNILRLPTLFYYVNNSIVSMMGCRGCGKESEVLSSGYLPAQSEPL